MDREATTSFSKAPWRWVACSLTLLSACGSSDEDTGGVIVLHDENNYHLVSRLTLPTIETAPAADLDICWSNLTTDIQCHPVAPSADIDNVGLLRFLHLTQPEVEAQLASDELSQSQVDGYVEYRTDHQATCTKLSRFSFFGTPIDLAAQYVESADETYMLVFTHGTQLGVGVRVMTFVRPTASSTNTRVDIPSGCGLLDLTVDIESSKKVAVSASRPWTVDWRGLTRSGQDGEVIFATLDGLLLGFYQGMTVTDLQTRFFDIESLATSLWEIPLSGESNAELGKAVERGTGAAFAGFTRTDGVWMLALLCRTCRNPAPVVLIILDPGKATR
jgi:hypothetical protein